MKITVLTICSLNYIAQAKTLGDSLLQHNPEYEFVIGLVDRVNERINPSFWEPYDLIEVENLKIYNFDHFWQKYDIVELNTSVKPFFIEYIFNKNPDVESIIYLDPDILVCNSLCEIGKKLELYNIIITPHIIRPHQNLKEKVGVLYETAMVEYGVYNLGFIAISRSQETSNFINWWKTRLEDHCFRDRGRLFVDQKWMNLAPIFFEGVYIEKGIGYNVAHWNIWEREITFFNNKYYVGEDNEELLFFHFSGYEPSKPQLVSTINVIKFSEFPELEPLFHSYREKILNNDYEKSINLKCYFVQNSEQYQQDLKKQLLSEYSFFRNILMFCVDNFIQLMPDTINNFLKKASVYMITKIELTKGKDYQH